jgi:hypothetical protein
MPDDFKFGEMGDRPHKMPKPMTPAEIMKMEAETAKMQKFERRVGIVFFGITGVSFLGFCYLVGRDWLKGDKKQQKEQGYDR